MLGILLWAALPEGLRANPSGGQVVSGQAAISSHGSTLTVNQLSDRAILHWQDFSIPSGSTARFVQPSAASAVLNRVTGGNPSQIHGTLRSNGQIYLINPNGILVGPGGIVDTGGFLASTLDVSNSSFLSGGDLRFKGDSTASVVNLGSIGAASGDVILIARTVENHGTIRAPQGTAALAAGSEVLVKAEGRERVFVEAGSASGASTATQAGLIEAAAAEIKAAGGNEYALAIKHSGVTRATGVEKRGGRVYLSAGKGTVRNSGTISARKGNGSGGKIRIEADHVELTSGSKLDASAQGVGNGGAVLVGGGYQGKDASIRNAQSVTAEEGSLIIADAATTGKGGTVILWSDGMTRFGGEISARGGSVSGDGGFAEVSGKRNLGFSGWVDTGGGTLLLDPANLTVQSSPGDQVNTWGVGQIDALLGVNDLILEADIDIAWNAATVLAYTNTASRTLTLRAGNSIVFGTGAAITPGAGAGALSVVLNSDRDATGGGNIQLTNAAIHSNGGDIVLGGGANPLTTAATGYGTSPAERSGIYLITGSSLNAGAGAISVRGTGFAGTTSASGIYLTGGSTIGSATSTGSIVLVGTGGAGTTDNRGVHLNGSSVAVHGAGAVSITGTGGAGSGAGNRGIFLETGARAEAYGVGTLTLKGYGGTGGSAHGVHFTSSGTVARVANGILRIEGEGGLGGGSNGIFLNSGAAATSTGSGAVVLEGTGGAEGIQNYGIQLAGGATVTSTGTGSGAATVTLDGTGGAGTGNNYGTYITAGGAAVRSVDGNITIIGTGGNGTSSNYGVVMTNDAVVESTGTGANAATVTLIGTGRGSGGSNHGFYIRDAGAQVRSQVGAIAYTGVGGGTSGNGIHFAGGSPVESTGSAPIAMTATGSGSAADFFATTTPANPNATGPTTLGGALATGNITIHADTIDWGATALTLRSTGHLLVQPRTATATIGLGNSAVGTLNLTAAELDGILDGFASITIGHAAGSGAVDVRGYTFKDNLVIRTPTGNGDITLNGALATGSGTQAGTIVLQAGRNLIGNTGASISTQGQSIILNSNRDGVGRGQILLSGTTVQSHGGNIVLGGGGDPTTGAAVSFSTGSTASNRGIYLSNSTIRSQGGSISMIGKGSDSDSGSRGIELSGSTVESTTGAVTMHGEGGVFAGGTQQAGVSLVTSTVASDSGPIELTGIGGGGGNSMGLLLWNGAKVVSRETAAITLNGTGTGTGVDLYSSRSDTSVSEIGNHAVPGKGGNIVLNINTTNWASVNTSFQSAGSITIQPRTTETTIGIGNSAIGTLSLTADRLDALKDGFSEIVIGHAGGSGAVDVRSYAFKDNLVIRTPTGNGDIALNGALSTGSVTQAGTIALLAGRNIVGSSGASVTTQGQSIVLNSDRDETSGGNIQLTSTAIASNGGAITLGGGADPLNTAAIGSGAGSEAQRAGIYLNGGSVNAGAGAVSLRGRGFAGTASAYGIHVLNGGKIGDAAATGSIALHGTGGAGTTSNHGVYLTGANTAVASASGAVSITGIGGDGGSSSYGIYALGGSTVGTGSGNLVLHGTGGSATAAGTSGNHGLVITGTNTAITSSSGAISITGRGGQSANGSNYGIQMSAAAQVVSTGTATIALEGEGGVGAAWNGVNNRYDGNNFGVYLLNANTLVTSVSGDVSITAKGGGGWQTAGDGIGGINRGLYIITGAKVTSTGTGANAAKLTLHATGGHEFARADPAHAFASQNMGLYMNNAGSAVQSVDGDISITGVGLPGTSNIGIFLYNGSLVQATGGADMRIVGEATTDFSLFAGAATSSLISHTGDIVIEANTWGSDVAASAGSISSTGGASAGRLILRPRTAGTTIGIGGGAGTLGLTAIRLGFIQDGFSEIVIGSETAGNLTAAAATFTDNLRLVTGGALAVNGALNVGSNRLALIAGGNTTQSAALTAGSLRLGGNGNFTLTHASNSIGTLAKDGTGSVSLTHAAALAVGAVDGVNGVTGSTVDLRTATGNLTLNQAVTGTASGNAVVISTPAAFVNNAGVSAVQTPSGRWLVYSNAPAGNTFGGLASGQTALYGRTIGSHAPGSIVQTGNRYVFATTPSLTVQATLSDSKTYGDTYAFPTPVAGTHYTLTGFVNAATYGNVFTQDTAANIGLDGAPVLGSAGAANTATVAGSPYVVTIAQGTLSNTGGYSFGAFNSGGGITVTQRAITLTATAATKIYGNTDPVLSMSVTGGSLGGSDTLADVAGTVGRQAGENVGLYDILLGTGAKAANYNITFDANNDAFGIAQRAITLTADAATKVYGNLDPALGVSIGSGSLATGDSLAEVTGTLTRQSGENVGLYDILLGTGTKASNYAITFDADNDAFAITQRSILLTANAASKTYGDADPALSVSLAVGDLATGETLADVTGTVGRQVGENVGLYDILLGTGTKTGNYAITFDADNDAFGITQRAITLTADSATKVYGNADPALSVSIGSGSLATGDTLAEVTGTVGRQAGENVGLYDILLGTGAKAGNYAITFDTDNDAFSITQRALTITANNQSKTYGDAFSFVGTEFTASGLINGDIVASASLSSAGAPVTAGVGGYAISIGGATGTGLGNYTIVYVDGTMTVNRRTLTITANNQSKTYGDAFVFAGTEFTVSGLVNGDTVTSANLSSRGAARSAGVAGAPYAIRIGSAAGTGLSNYAITYRPGSMGVRPTRLLVTANDAIRTQGQSNPAFSASYSGFVLGEGPGDLSGVLRFAVKGGGSSSVGAYAIVPYGLRSENYRIRYAAGQLTVLPGGGAGDLLERSDMADPFSFLKGYGQEESEADEEDRGGRVEYTPRDYPGSLLHLSSGEVE